MILDDILDILKKSDNTAYEIGNKNYTYKELYKYVCNIYYYLLENNTDYKPVVIYGHKEIYMKASFLACSFAGMPYVPIDEGTPNERVEQIINQIKPEIIIGKNITKKEITNIMNNEQYKNINKILMNPDDIYYIIFTSGSTGIPKGVKITYKNLNSCVNWLNKISKIKNRNNS